MCPSEKHTAHRCSSIVNMCTVPVATVLNCNTEVNPLFFTILAGIVTVHLPKLHTGEYFNNLGMLTTLLSKKPAGNMSKTAKPPIEVMAGICK